jgi:hypothetical protein
MDRDVRETAMYLGYLLAEANADVDLTLGCHRSFSEQGQRVRVKSF